MAETMCLPTGTAKASKLHSQPAQKYAENSGFALVKSAPARQAGSVSSLLGVLHVASWHETDMAERPDDVCCSFAAFLTFLTALLPTSCVTAATPQAKCERPADPRSQSLPCTHHKPLPPLLLPRVRPLRSPPHR